MRKFQNIRSLKPLVASVLAASLFSSCSSSSDLEPVHGSGQRDSQIRHVSSFTSLEVEDSADVDVSVGPTTSLTVTTDGNLLPLVETSVIGDTLKIRSTRPIDSELGVKIRISVPSLESLAISGSGSIHAGGLSSKTIALAISGSGVITAKGTADKGSMSVNGAGRIEAGELLTQDAKVSITGTGTITVFAGQSLSASVAGVGAIRYLGHPGQVEKNVSGIGSIEPR